MSSGIRLHNRYEVLAEIARGTKSVLYKAHDVALERHVALKAFFGLTDEPSIARIQREAVIFGKLNHPRIVSLYDVFTEERRFYLVLEFVEGTNLAETLRVTPLRLKEVIRIETQLLDALSYAHSENVVHRDVKPSNILIRKSDGNLVLTDFNTGKSLQESSEITSVGAFVGTILYASPEQLNNEAVTTASDVYSAGLVFSEMLLGRAPDPKIASRASPVTFSNDIIVSIRKLNPPLPAPLLELLASLLSVQPKNRPSAAEARDALKGLEATLEDDHLNMETARIGIGSLTVHTLRTDANTVDGVPIGVTQVDNAPSAKPSGFFAQESLRVQAFDKSVEFFRSHLDRDYSNLLGQAKLAFALWLASAGIAFVVLVAGIILLFQERTVEGAVTLASETLIIFIQRVFKQREDYYREQANEKHRHLQMGSMWSLAIQSADGITDANLREKKMSAVIDALVKGFAAKEPPKSEEVKDKLA